MDMEIPKDSYPSRLRKSPGRARKSGNTATTLKALKILLLAAGSRPAFRYSTSTDFRHVDRFRSHQRVHMSPSDDIGDLDWRAFRAKLVQQDSSTGDKEDEDVQTSDSKKVSKNPGFAFEYGIIEQGSVILGGTEQDYGFALRQQYFHKCVMLVFAHNEYGTQGVILNRPTAYYVDGWRLWFGGDVHIGPLFNALADDDVDKGDLFIMCLHQIPFLANVSMPIIKGIWYTSFEMAQRLVVSGAANRSDFWVIAGMAGWRAEQLQGELDRKSWFLASVDSDTLLRELLRQALELPASEAIALDDGLGTWETLMKSIGRAGEVERTHGCLADRMLNRWCRAVLSPRDLSGGNLLSSTFAPKEPLLSENASSSYKGEALPIGSVFRMGTPTARVLLKEQHLHKAVLVKVHEDLLGNTYAAVLNRPLAGHIPVRQPDQSIGGRRASYGGTNLPLGMAKLLDIDGYGILWLGYGKSLDDLSQGVELGASGLRRVSSTEARKSIEAGQTTIYDYIAVRGLTKFKKRDLHEMLDHGHIHVVKDARSLWPTLWELLSGSTLENPDFRGTNAWRTAATHNEDNIQQEFNMSIITEVGLGDEALEEWQKFSGAYADAQE